MEITSKSLHDFLNKFNQLRKRNLSNRNFVIVAAFIVGIVGGSAASLLKSLTHHIAEFLQNDLEWKYKAYFYLLFPLTGIMLSVWYVKRFIVKDKFETGLTPILYSIAKKSSKVPYHNIYSQIVTSALTVGFGGSVGLEAPIVTSGAAIGSNAGKFFGLNYRETTMLLACGAAAGIAGAFNSPVAGIVFAIEVLLPEFSIPALLPLLISAATASVVARVFYTEQLFYLVTTGWVLQALPFYTIMAILIGLYSIFVTKLTYLIKSWAKKIKSEYLKVLAGGLILGLLIFIFPALYGEGYLTIKQLLAGDYKTFISNSLLSAYTGIPWILVVFTIFTVFGKALATLITLAAGGNGGIFGPSLIMGGLFGFAFATGINLTGLMHLNVANFIVAGMAASLSGILHAPLTGIFLIAEVTGGYALMVPLMIVSSISYLINRVSQKYSIYTKILAESGELLSHENKDRIVLRMMKLKYLIEVDYIHLNPNETPHERSKDIIASKRNIFPVLDNDGKFLGIVYSEQLFSVMLDNSSSIQIGELLQSAPDIVYFDEHMSEVMKKMEKEDIWMLPVLNKEERYLGFISKSAILNKYRSLLIRQGNYLQ